VELQTSKYTCHRDITEHTSLLGHNTVSLCHWVCSTQTYRRIIVPLYSWSSSPGRPVWHRRWKHYTLFQTLGTIVPTTYFSIFNFFNFNLFCVRLIHRGYDPSDMELVYTENKVTNMHDVRYNTINFRIQLSRQHSDYNVIAEGLY
jgi:hypothetical protein